MFFCVPSWDRQKQLVCGWKDKLSSLKKYQRVVVNDDDDEERWEDSFGLSFQLSTQDRSGYGKCRRCGRNKKVSSVWNFERTTLVDIETRVSPHSSVASETWTLQLLLLVVVVCWWIFRCKGCDEMVDRQFTFVFESLIKIWNSFLRKSELRI